MNIAQVSSSVVLLLLLGSPTSAGLPCTSSQLAAPPVVEESAGALQLAAAVNCSGGSFDVEWAGSVIVGETIRLFGGTTLSITGAADRTSVVNGANVTYLFEVDGGTLHLDRLTLVNGNGKQGGAIKATDAILTTASCTISNNTGTRGGGAFLDSSVMEIDNSYFTHNTAAGYGGAIYMEASNVTMGENVLFENNQASSGGALFAEGRSILTVAGDNISITRNTATTYGGGLYVYESATNVTGEVEFFGNTAQSGGAVATDSGPVTVTGDVLFSSNLANGSGGAFDSSNSFIDIAGTIVWQNNSALSGLGGGLTMWKTTVHVHALGQAAFIGNTAGYAGAAYMSTSTLVVDGDVLFAENTAVLGAGALYSDNSTINVSGNALWENNRTPASGGGLLMWTSNMHVQRSGTTSFVGNTAQFGGAAYINPGMLMASGYVSFSANHADVDGGALYVSIAVVDIAGAALWNNNTAGGQGGAITAFQSEIFVQSSGKAEFVYNAATYFGGAAYVDNTPLRFDGDVVFAGNVADNDGGALYSDISAINVTGTAVWKDNSAKRWGGGLLMSNSTLHVSSLGTAEFFRNNAYVGGGIYLFQSCLSIDGDVIFAMNVVDDFGGALFGHKSVINVRGTTAWENNTSLNSGGGVAILESVLGVVAGSNARFSNNTAIVGGGMYVGENAELVVKGFATFSHNGAESGAGIEMAKFSSTNFTGGSVMMLGNTASSSGGGMHCESPTLLGLDGVNFVSNYGGVRGGAITMLLAGTERVAETEAKPAAISNCSFSGNTAGDAGGAVFIAGGFVEITDSDFVDNTAGMTNPHTLNAYASGRSGGAVLASGVVSLEDCTFVGNQAGVGSAVTNTVSVYFSRVHFINNTLLCDDNALFLDWNDTSSFATACESCARDCYNCTVENPNKVQECRPVLEHTTSVAPNGALESLTLQRGFWRSSGTSKEIRECYETSACVGGTEEYCNEGYQGPLCAVCADGYTAALGYTCSKCNVERRSATITIAAVVFAAALVMVAQGLKFLGKYSHTDQMIDGEVTSTRDVEGGQRLFEAARASQALKVVVVSWQLVTQFSMVASITYPDLYNTFLKYVNVINLNLGWILSAGCLVDTNFYDNLLVSTVTPLVVFGVVATSHRVTSIRHSTSDRQTRARIDHRHASALFWVSFLVYATASSTIFQTFACVDFDNGMSYLRADHSLECHTTKHTMFRVYASVMGLIYPFGIPFCYAAILYGGRHNLKDLMARETFTSGGSVVRELWVAYRPEAYFYEVVECARRVLLSGVVVFIFPNTAGQIAVAFLLALFFAAVFMILDPYTSLLDTWAARTGHTVVLMSMFAALLEKVNIEEDDYFSQNAFGIVLVLVNCVMIVAAGAEVCGMCFVTVQEIRQPIRSLSRTSSVSSAVRAPRHAMFPTALGEDVEQTHC